VYHPIWLTDFEHSEIDGSEKSAPYRYRWHALIVICAALMIGQIDMTIVNMALPSIATDLGAGTSGLQWVMDSYTIVLAGFVLLGGGLAERYGRKGVFMTGLAIFGIASITGTWATEMWQLIASRSLMGLGAALFFPPALSIVAVIFPKGERAKAIAIWSAAGGIGTVAGPVVGGFLLESWWWGSVLLVNVPVVVIALIGAALLIPTSRRPGSPPLDRIGAGLSVSGLGIFIFGVIEGPQHGWISPLIVGALLVGAALIVCFILWELRTRFPMLEVRVFRLGGVMAGGLGLTVNLLVITGALFLLPMYLQTVVGESPLVVGLLLMPFGLFFGILVFTSGPATKKVGVRITLPIGLVGMAAGLGVLAYAPSASGLWAILVGTAIVGAGAAYVAAPGTTAVLDALPAAQAGDGSAVNQVTRQVGAAFGVAIAGSILASIYSRDLEPALSGLSSSDASLADGSIDGANSVAASLSSGSQALLDAADAAFISGYRVAMLVPAALAILTALVVLLRVPAVAEPSKD
jgi:DHA2 family multidrug resistance protein-like MFS transporter